MTKITTEIELIGISTAAIIGDNFPVTAKYIPIRLYKKESTKLIFIIKIAFLARRRTKSSTVPG